MRPTQVRLGEMPGRKPYPQNEWWGSHGVTHQKGIIQYSLSPVRQRACKNMIQNYIFNGYRRLSAQFAYWIVPVAIGFGTYTWAKRYDTYINSKEAHVAGHAHS
ncbi:hypothetical protein CERSUDRAFT_51699 [Gelatoporia subvermispora B]|uniref:Cytochrome b-c1 complex subunit 8 n=1 Tax=Ceriporiopsis subvermispora (strain B) TaxID=914234 RepID=M2PL60_CERS8|nr:hypothetical protein CERSUDRAFT_51699 [Gelatoporia subvermispora B]